MSILTLVRLLLLLSSSSSAPPTASSPAAPPLFHSSPSYTYLYTGLSAGGGSLSALRWGEAFCQTGGSPKISREGETLGLLGKKLQKRLLKPHFFLCFPPIFRFLSKNRVFLPFFSKKSRFLPYFLQNLSAFGRGGRGGQLSGHRVGENREKLGLGAAMGGLRIFSPGWGFPGNPPLNRGMLTGYSI